MLDTQVASRTFRQKTSSYVMVSLTAAIFAASVALFFSAVRTGPHELGTLIFGAGALFFGSVCFLGIRSLRTIVADDQGLRSSACWGLFKEQLAWPDVESLEYVAIVDRAHGVSSPRTYSFMRRGQLKRLGARPRCMLLSDDLEDFSGLMALVREKSSKWGFPISPLSQPLKAHRPTNEHCDK